MEHGIGASPGAGAPVEALAGLLPGPGSHAGPPNQPLEGRFDP
jgi:hypothetical protein